MRASVSRVNMLPATHICHLGSKIVETLLDGFGHSWSRKPYDIRISKKFPLPVTSSIVPDIFPLADSSFIGETR